MKARKAQIERAAAVAREPEESRASSQLVAAAGASDRKARAGRKP